MTPVRTSRLTLLATLESVEGGLAPDGLVDQSSCFAFAQGHVHTFNDEVYCKRKASAFPEAFEGAVKADKLLKMLRMIEEDEVEIQNGGEDFIITAVSKKEQAKFKMEETVLLPINEVEVPPKWQPMHDDFNQALSIVNECAGTDESKFALTCVHLHPKYMEASDNDHMARYKVPTGVAAPILVRAASIKKILPLDMTEMAETEGWIHFRNPAGLQYSCRKHLEEYHDFGPYYSITNAHRLIMPKGMEKAAEKAGLFSADNQDYNRLYIDLIQGKVRITGQSDAGKYTKIIPVHYQGKSIAFVIAPNILIKLVKKFNEAEINSDMMLVTGDKWRYSTSLEAPAVKAEEE